MLQLYKLTASLQRLLGLTKIASGVLSVLHISIPALLRKEQTCLPTFFVGPHACLMQHTLYQQTESPKCVCQPHKLPQA